MFNPEAPIEVFCCYASEDDEWRRKLETHLSLLKRQGLISTWHDGLVRLSGNWGEDSDSHLNSASVILLLISADFLASDYCYGNQMERALQRQAAGEARVLPILVRAVDLIPAPFTRLQVLPTDARPLSTWSDPDTALTDVVAGIRRVIEDLSLLAVSAPGTTQSGIWNVPYPRNSFFTGRDDLLERLHKRLQAGQTTALSQPQAISGLGGIGKTQIAIEYAYRYRQEYEAVLWASAETQEALISSYNTIAALLGLPERETSEQEIIIQAIKKWLQTHHNWLLILDNADELDLLPPFLPPDLGGHLLLTTRASDMQRLAQRLEVETLADEQGAMFLLRRAGLLTPEAKLAHAIPTEQALAWQLTREMGGLPLALDQAGAYLEATGMSLSEYQRVYRQHRQVLLQERRARIPDHPEPVATTWSLSFARVQQKSPAAADLLRLCAFLSPDAIAEEILTEAPSVLGPLLESVVGDPLLLSQAVEALRAYSLVGRDPRARTLSVHRLVQAVLQDGMDKEDRRLWIGRAMRAVNVAFLHVEHLQRDRLIPHALHCAEMIRMHRLAFSEAPRFLNQIAGYLREYARSEEAEPLYLLALQICEQAFPQICEQVLGKDPKVPLSSGKLDATLSPFQGSGSLENADSDKEKNDVESRKASRQESLNEGDDSQESHPPLRQQDKDAKVEENKIIKKLINDPKDIVKQTLAGMLAAHSDLIRINSEQQFVVRKRTPARNKVRIVSGGGSGHEPFHCGFVGFGMLDAACCGPIFTSPTEDQIIAATRTVKSGAGILYIVKNYLGDKSNFMSAVVELAAGGIDIAVVFVNDDVGVPNESACDRRGMGVTVLLEKIVGSYAETKAPLHEVKALAEKVNANGRSMGMALTSCILPATGKPLFELGKNKMTIGSGIHGQCGHSIVEWKTANEITELLVSPIIDDLGLKAGEKVLAMVSGMGGTPLCELYIVFNALKGILNGKGITISRQLVGNYMTSLEMAGCSITLLRLDDKLTRYWDASVRTPALCWSR